MSDELEDHREAMHALFAEDGYAGRIGAELTGWGGGWSQVELTVAADHANFAGLLHGGVTFGLGDAAFAVASNSWGRLAVALSVDVQFLGTVPAGAGLVATARERHRTKRTGAYLIEVRARPDGPRSPEVGGVVAEAVGPEAVGPEASGADRVGPEADAVGPGADAVGPGADRVAPGADRVAPGADAVGPLIGSLHALVHRTDRWLLGEEAWSADWRATH